MPLPGWVRILKGWWGKALWIDLTREEVKIWEYPKELAQDFVGGRGFAIKILWDFLEPGTDPLSPQNLVVLAVGPVTGLCACSGKMVIASKSPLTGGYGDGNIGSWAAIHLKRAGIDAVIITGRAKKPSYIYIENGKAHILSAEGLWGLSTFETERKLREVHGKDVGILTIGPAGENLVKIANVISQEGRAGGRPGLGAVLGSKNIKAVVIRGDLEVPVADANEVRKLFVEASTKLRSSPGYGMWLRQGTMATIEWSQNASVLPTMNFREGVFDEWRNIDGYAMEAMKVAKRSCPQCVMPCGNVVLDAEGKYAEVDYENVAMLGSNIGLGHLGKVAVLNRLADELGIDTISLGNVLGFAIEASQKGLLKDEKLEWGDFNKMRELVTDIAYRRGIGNLLAEGVKRVSEKIGGKEFAMHVKGLEISAYDCHAAPGMALAYATSPIGAHHKDAWVISWEIRTDRFGYTREKVEKVIELQRIRGGFFESLVACRLPWVELGLELDLYLRVFKAVTGVSIDMNYVYNVADRIYTLIRAFWIREHGTWSRDMDMPPARWFKEPLTKGPLAGRALDYEQFNKMLSMYYELRGWDERGVPKKSTLQKLGLDYVIPTLEKIVGLS